MITKQLQTVNPFNEAELDRIMPIPTLDAAPEEPAPARPKLAAEVAAQISSMTPQERARVIATPGARGTHGVAKKLAMAQAKRVSARELEAEARELERSAGVQADAIEAGTPDRPDYFRKSTMQNGKLVLPKTIHETVPMLRPLMTGAGGLTTLFGAGRSRGHRVGAVLGTVTDKDGVECTLRYTGIGLTQAELDVWLEVINLCRDAGKSTIEISATAFLKRLGREAGGENYQILLKQLRLLNSIAFSVEMDGMETFLDVKLIRGTVPKTADAARRLPLRLSLDENFAALYGQGAWASVDLRARRQLNGDTSRWLHTWISASSSPHPVKIETLQERAGDSTEPHKFRQKLAGAVKELIDAEQLHPESRVEKQGTGQWWLITRRRIRAK